MNQTFISAGSNLGDRKANLDSAVASLSKWGEIKKVSSYFETEPVGYLDQPWFLNIALQFETSLTARELLKYCQSIEESCGRIRTFRNAPRTLDLDILLFADIVVQEQDLIIPHPRMAERRFVLEPLAEIAPDTIHPVLKASIRALLDACRDSSRIRILPSL